MMIGETSFEVYFEEAESLCMSTESFLLLVIVKRKPSHCWNKRVDGSV